MSTKVLELLETAHSIVKAMSSKGFELVECRGESYKSFSVVITLGEVSHVLEKGHYGFSVTAKKNTEKYFLAFSNNKLPEVVKAWSNLSRKQNEEQEEIDRLCSFKKSVRVPARKTLENTSNDEIIELVKDSSEILTDKKIPNSRFNLRLDSFHLMKSYVNDVESELACETPRLRISLEIEAKKSGKILKYSTLVSQYVKH